MQTTNLDIQNNAIQVYQPDAQVTVTVQSGDTVYYGPTSQVSASLNTGSLAPGQSVTVTQETWVVSASTSSIQIQVSPVQGSGTIGTYQAASTPGAVTGRVSYYDQAGNLLGYLPVYATIT